MCDYTALKGSLQKHINTVNLLKDCAPQFSEFFSFTVWMDDVAKFMFFRKTAATLSPRYLWLLFLFLYKHDSMLAMHLLLFILWKNPSNIPVSYMGINMIKNNLKQFEESFWQEFSFPLFLIKKTTSKPKKPSVSPAYFVSLLWAELFFLDVFVPLHPTSTISYILLYSQWFIVTVFPTMFSHSATPKYSIFLLSHFPGKFLKWRSGEREEWANSGRQREELHGPLI